MEPDAKETSFVVLPPKPISPVAQSTSSSSSDDEDEDKPNIPDGGWGWVVVVAAFLLQMIADGVTFSFGLLYVEFLKEFGASASATSWIGSLFMAMPLMSGPLMSALVDKYGCRIMTMAGGVVSALGFVISSKCNSIGYMYLTFGVLAGMGLGVIYVTVVVSLAFWFDKKRNLAVGIGSSGIGFGTFVFSPLTTYLINEFSWRGTTLILGGCFLNMCICGALMRDPDWIIEQERRTSKTKQKKASPGSALDLEELRSILTSKQEAESFFHSVESSLENSDQRRVLMSCVNLPTFLGQQEKVPVEVLDLLSQNRNLFDLVVKNYPSLVLNRDHQVRVDLSNNGNREVIRERASSIHQETFEPLIEQKPLRHHHDKYFKNLKIGTHSLVYRGGGVFNTNKYKFKASSCPNIYRVSMVAKPKKREEKWYTEVVDLLRGMFDFSLFLELHFFLFSLSTVTLFIWFIVPYFYLVELMLKNGYSGQDASFTIGNIGISSTIGMIVMGWAGDRPWINLSKVYAICLVFCGLSIGGMMVFINNFVILELCCTLFGVSLSSHFAFTCGIVMEMVPLERFTLAYGLQLLCQGIGTLIGPPYAGLLYDVTGTWEQTFYQGTIWMILSGIFVWFIPYTRNVKMIGKGDVEKRVEGTRNQAVPIVILILVFIGFSVYVGYLTGLCFLL